MTSTTHTVAILATADTDPLDLAQVVAAFRCANQILKRPAHQLYTLSISGETVCTLAGLTVDASPLSIVPPQSVDFLIIASGSWNPETDFGPDTIAGQWLRHVVDSAKQISTINGGAAVLASLGMKLPSLVVHFDAWLDMSRHFPAIQFNCLRLFHNEGKIWSVSGGTATLDMLVSAIKQKHGEKISQTLAGKLFANPRAAYSLQASHMPMTF